MISGSPPTLSIGRATIYTAGTPDTCSILHFVFCPLHLSSSVSQEASGLRETPVYHAWRDVVEKNAELCGAGQDDFVFTLLRRLQGQLRDATCAHAAQGIARFEAASRHMLAEAGAAGKERADRQHVNVVLRHFGA